MIDANYIQFYGPFACDSEAMDGDSHWPSLGHAFGQAKVLPDCVQGKAASQQVAGQGAVVQRRRRQ